MMMMMRRVWKKQGSLMKSSIIRGGLNHGKKNCCLIGCSSSSSIDTRYFTTASTETYDTIETFREARSKLGNNKTVGFVPTMGALHEGHLSLVKEARQNNDVLVSSVFVNPTQFGPNEDLDKYPRQLERDIEMLSELGVDMVFAPNHDDMYTDGFSTYVEPHFEETKEGQSRPGFFRGVATIVTKLFNIVQPSRAYFGQKDAVQCCVIRRIVTDLNIPTEVVVMPTVREEDGLAMSSRNAYLTDEERAKSSIVYKSLMAGQDVWSNNVKSTINAGDVEDAVRATLTSEPLVKEIQYVTIDSWNNMKRCDTLDSSETYVMSLAVKVGNVRLIDNIVLNPVLS